MSRAEQAALAVLAGLAFVLLVVLPASAPRELRDVQGAVEGVSWEPGPPPGHAHLAMPSEIGSVIWGPHPLYCDPKGPGKHRDALIARGWENWMADPPGEVIL